MEELDGGKARIAFIWQSCETKEFSSAQKFMSIEPLNGKV